jgi:mono/diheme cytochrome c family protein
MPLTGLDFLLRVHKNLSLVFCGAFFLASHGAASAGQTDGQVGAIGKKIEATACVACHSVRLIHSQRLSAAAWTKEVDKMIGWGAVVPNKQSLIDYLATEYSNSKPVPTPDTSGDGVSKASGNPGK